MKNYIHYFLLLSVSFFFNQKGYSQTSEIQAKSSFIYNFTRYIEWPPSSKSGDFIIGVYASSAIFNELQNYTSDKKVGSQAIVIKKINSIDDITGIHMLFVPFGKTKEMPAIVTKIGDNKIIIIAEKSGALEQGATINFVLTDDNKLKYEIKTSNAIKIGLKCNSVLEKMALSRN